MPSGNAVRLTLPDTLRCHPVFNVSFVRPSRQHELMRHFEPPPVGEKAGQDLYEVDSIISERILKGERQYLVAWKGYGPEQRTYVSASSMQEDAPEAAEDYHNTLVSTTLQKLRLKAAKRASAAPIKQKRGGLAGRGGRGSHPVHLPDSFGDSGPF